MAKAKRRLVVRFREDRAAWEMDYRNCLGKRHRPPFREAEALDRAAQVRKGASRSESELTPPPRAAR